MPSWNDLCNIKKKLLSSCLICRWSILGVTHSSGHNDIVIICINVTKSLYTFILWWKCLYWKKETRFFCVIGSKLCMFIVVVNRSKNWQICTINWQFGETWHLTFFGWTLLIFQCPTAYNAKCSRKWVILFGYRFPKSNPEMGKFGYSPERIVKCWSFFIKLILFYIFEKEWKWTIQFSNLALWDQYVCIYCTKGYKSKISIQINKSLINGSIESSIVSIPIEYQYKEHYCNICRYC